MPPVKNIVGSLRATFEECTATYQVEVDVSADHAAEL